jgi:hypothetical protein
MTIRTESVEADESLARQRCRQRRVLAAAVVVTVLVAGGVYLSHSFGVSHHTAAGPQDNTAATPTRPVTRRSLSQTTSVSGTLGYAGGYAVVAHLHGTITALPDPGTVIGQGQVLYRVDNQPVVLLSGSTPAYRTLAEGATATDVTGPDVAELNQDLVALGYADKSNVDAAWDEFSWATKAGVEDLQRHLGVDQTGRLTLGQVVFLPTAARVTTVLASLGGPVGGTVLMATSTTRQISVNLDADLQSQVATGDKVTITLPDGPTPGVVSSVGKVATTPSSGAASGPGSNSPTVLVEITPTNPAATGSLDQAPVQIAITTATVHDVLAVPVNALLALSGGGYAVEVVNSDGTHHLIAVSLGLVDDADGIVQLSGSGLAAGQHVVVPAS